MHTHTSPIHTCLHIYAYTNQGKYSADIEAIAVEAREGEECRICLKQGFRRKCCGEWFCSTDYFKDGHCPSCNARVEQKTQFKVRVYGDLRMPTFYIPFSSDAHVTC